MAQVCLWWTVCLALYVGTGLRSSEEWALLRGMRHTVPGCNTEDLAVQVLLGIAAGAWLLTPEWLAASAAAGRWLDEHRFAAEVPIPALSWAATQWWLVATLLVLL